jgi:hypothetical protein
MGRAGRRRVLDKFSWHAVAVATAAAYEEVISLRERAASTSSTDDHEETASADR